MHIISSIIGCIIPEQNNIFIGGKMEIRCKDIDELKEAVIIFCDNALILNVVQNIKEIVYIELNSFTHGERLVIQYLGGKYCIYENAKNEVIIRMDTEETENMKINELFKTTLGERWKNGNKKRIY